jgi:hypothetical protein
MSLHFLLKNKSEGGISSGKIGMRSSTKMTLELGFPKLDCRGVNEVIGVPISVDGCGSTILTTTVVGVEGASSCPCFR